ncbi:T9SS type A sorting domain-containing protein [Porphyromonas endodontalis]|uniref:T9SS type A sorting domain-containing protein n=1 Tax=Porphyromonas endodontalis TaxID=28124 RepID=UPI0028E30656|nr:T9SS type A sorting domain-containing protein [Porphyromonas endodontalis]
MKKTLYILLATLCCSMLSFAQDNKESIVLKSEGKALAEIVLSIRAEGEVSIQGANSVKVDEQGRYVCVLPDSDDPEITLTISASRILGLTLDEIATTSLDLRHAPSLTHLDCGLNGGSIRGLDLSSLENLVYLNCSKQEIALLDLEKNEKLETLLCSENKLSELDVQHLKQLKRLECSQNQLTELDLNNLDKLESVNATGNKIRSPKLGGLIHLKSLSLTENPLEKVLKIDLPELEWLKVSRCGLEKIELVNAPNLEGLACSENKLSSLDLANANTKIQFLECFLNNIDGTEMGKLIASLPDWNDPKNPGNGKCYAMSYGFSPDDPDENEKNFAYEDDIKMAWDKQWTFMAKTKDGKEFQYAGRPRSTQQIANSEIVILPNPARDFVSIRGVSPSTEVRILDLSGKLLVESLCRNDGILNLDVRDIPEGNYLIVINGSSQKLAIIR